MKIKEINGLPLQHPNAHKNCVRYLLGCVTRFYKDSELNNDPEFKKLLNDNNLKYEEVSQISLNISNNFNTNELDEINELGNNEIDHNLIQSFIIQLLEKDFVENQKSLKLILQTTLLEWNYQSTVSPLSLIFQILYQQENSIAYLDANIKNNLKNDYVHYMESAFGVQAIIIIDAEEELSKGDVNGKNFKDLKKAVNQILLANHPDKLISSSDEEKETKAANFQKLNDTYNLWKKLVVKPVLVENFNSMDVDDINKVLIKFYNDILYDIRRSDVHNASDKQKLISNYSLLIEALKNHDEFNVLVPKVKKENKDNRLKYIEEIKNHKANKELKHSQHNSQQKNDSSQRKGPIVQELPDDYTPPESNKNDSPKVNNNYIPPKSNKNDLPEVAYEKLKRQLFSYLLKFSNDPEKLKGDENFKKFVNFVKPPITMDDLEITDIEEVIDVKKFLNNSESTLTFVSLIDIMKDLSEKHNNEGFRYLLDHVFFELALGHSSDIMGILRATVNFSKARSNDVPSDLSKIDSKIARQIQYEHIHSQLKNYGICSQEYNDYKTIYSNFEKENFIKGCYRVFYDVVFKVVYTSYLTEKDVLAKNKDNHQRESIKQSSKYVFAFNTLSIFGLTTLFYSHLLNPINSYSDIPKLITLGGDGLKNAMLTSGALVLCSFLVVGAVIAYSERNDGRLNTASRTYSDEERVSRVKESFDTTSFVTNALWVTTLCCSILSTINTPALFLTPLPQITIGILAMDAMIYYCTYKEFKTDKAVANEKSNVPESNLPLLK